MLVSVRTMAQEKRQRRRSKEAAETSSTASDLHDELHSFHNTVHHYCNTNSDGRVRQQRSSPLCESVGFPPRGLRTQCMSHRNLTTQERIWAHATSGAMCGEPLPGSH
jgi:hypothetical protein